MNTEDKEFFKELALTFGQAVEVAFRKSNAERQTNAQTLPEANDTANAINEMRAELASLGSKVDSLGLRVDKMGGEVASLGRKVNKIGGELALQGNRLGYLEMTRAGGQRPMEPRLVYGGHAFMDSSDSLEEERPFNL